MLVLGESGGHFDETRREDALCQLRQSLEALNASRFAGGRVHRAVLEAPLHAEQVNPRLWQRKPDLDVLTRCLRSASTTAVVPRDHHLDNTSRTDSERATTATTSSNSRLTISFFGDVHY